MEWFRKKTRDLAAGEKKDIPDGVWTKCKGCGEIITVISLKKNYWTCPKCDYHFRITSADYINLILDDGRLEEYDANMTSADPLVFRDTKRYMDRIAEARKKTGVNDAVICGIGKIDGREVSFAVMEFAFIGGSMGSVVGEKVARAIERSLQRKIPLIIISCSGGARMMEGVFSLMQLAKTSALLARLDKMKIPFISILTNPTTAGVMASYASLGDVIIAEPQALLGFAGPRVIAQTIGGELPPGFQSSEFFLEHGFLDSIVHRSKMRKAVITLLDYLAGPK
ncbi:MAG: acetyl-CoA carboxylase carboxyltransferase subunit beta [candidate division Zixibacteria bacterium]|jgi:acetyl-CoA carboxylase carboxyl transferase subunit beta|nr:acetyl-CoA carboxylase carboxyltransferase subunit beta [candidate division Zixibacteria bacterium]